jgi:hypothetical protein
VGVVLQGLIVATSAGSGLQQQQQQLLFSAGDLSWFFLCKVFEKSTERVSCNFQQQSPPANIKKPQEKRYKFFLEKTSTPRPSIKQPLKQKQLNTH